jgi:transcriptional regulator with XRE-family HTH domain
VGQLKPTSEWLPGEIVDMLSTMQELPEIGPLLKEQRLVQDWTLDELAGRSGVSRSMVSQIERGHANPTFATLWSLTQALGVDLNELTRADQARSVGSIHVATPELTPVMTSDDDNVMLRILSPTGLADVAEWYELRFAPGATLRSKPHGLGTVEHLTVLDGKLRVLAGDAEEVFAAGGTARYGADLDHEISNPTKKTARALLVVIARSVQ